MFFYSTRNQQQPQSLSQAILSGLATDGGLYLPEYFPQINLAELDPNLSYPQFAAKILSPFFAGDRLAPQLEEICQQAFNFPLVLRQLKPNTKILELFHGPTLSFKDFGARFLAECLTRLSTERKTTIMVATSGDTGSAVASAFYHKDNIKVVVLFPQGQVSPRQQQQLTCWGDNILALAVKGNFDDCQKIVKQAFSDPWWQSSSHLSSANSINIARLLAQLTYYAYSSWQAWLASGTTIGYVVPTGNLGNATAAYWAKSMGFPLREIALATNANRVIAEYLISGEYTPRATIATLANAMDVGNPSNFERLSALFKTPALFNANVTATSVSDAQISATIQAAYHESNYILCPHTATAYFTRAHLSTQDWIIVATADPCKFEMIIEPLIQTTLVVPAQLQSLLAKPAKVIEVAAELHQVQLAVESSARNYPQAGGI